MWVILAALAATAVVLVRWRRSGQGLIPFLGFGLVFVYARLWHGLRQNRPVPLPEKGPALLVANYTGSTDAALLTACSNRPLSFLVAADYVTIRWLGGLFAYLGCVPVARVGCDAAAARRALRRLEEGRVVCVFPEGGLSNAGRVRPRRGKAGAAYLALKSRAPAIPACVRGGPQTSRVLRSWLYPSRAWVAFGEPVDLTSYYTRQLNRRLLDEVTEILMERVASLDGRRRNRTTRDAEKLPCLSRPLI
jgi:1-acyl-sn-glycerol-3-phosphate acyltransferase